MFFGRILELNLLLGPWVFVCLIIVIIFDWLLWLNNSADVDRSGSCMLFEMINQSLQFVLKITRLLDRIFETNDPFILRLLLLFRLFFQLFVGFFLFRIFFPGLLDLWIFVLKEHLILGLLRLIQKPASKKVDWILWLGPVSDSHAPGDDKTNIIAFQILRLRIRFLCHLI